MTRHERELAGAQEAQHCRDMASVMRPIYRCCQREGCGKPLRPQDEVVLWIKRDPQDHGEQCVFCQDCANDIQA